MKKNKIITLAIVLIVAISCSTIIFANNSDLGTSLKSKFSNFGKINMKYSKDQDKTVAFTVNGEDITLSQFNKRKELDEQAGKTNIKDSDVIKSIVKNKSLLTEAKKRGIVISDEEAKSKSLQEKEKLYDSATSNEDREAVLEYITSLGISDDEYWNDYNVKQYKDYLAVNALYEQVTKDAEDNGNIKSEKTNQSDFILIKKQYFADYTDNLCKNAVIDFKDISLKSNFDNNK